MWREAQKADSIQSAEEKAQEDFINVYKYEMGWNEEEGADFS